MDCWKIQENNFVCILFEHYMEMHSLQDGVRGHIVDTENLKRLIADLKKEEKEFIFIDMRYIFKAVSRAFKFMVDDEILEKTVFFNINEESQVKEYLDVDLQGMVEKRSEHSLFIFFSKKAKEQFLQTDLEKLYKQKRINMLRSYMNKQINFLQSSGVYSSMSLDYKKMFENPQDFKFAVGELFYKILEIKNNTEIDCLVAASKNAMVLTTILSSQLNIPVSYHTNIGQKYVKQKSPDKIKHQRDDIRTKKRFLMIFDVICLGTEARILNAIINILDGELIGAVGLVCVQDPDEIRKYDTDSILAKAQCIATTKEMELEYRIALTRKELGEKTE